jgi:hypothetical protein
MYTLRSREETLSAFLDHPTVGSHAMSRLGPGGSGLGNLDSGSATAAMAISKSTARPLDIHRYIGQRLSDGGALHSAPCTTEHTANLEPLVVP